MENNSENFGQNTIHSGSLYGIFKNHKEARKTLTLILNRGYGLEEIEINPPDMGDLIPNPNKNHHPSGDEFMKDAIQGLKIGAIGGLVISIVVVGLNLLTSGENGNGSIFFSFFSGVIVGALWGSMLGFFVIPHLPKPIWRIFSKSPLENKVTVTFEAHNMVDAVYFSKKGRLKVAH